MPKTTALIAATDLLSRRSYAVNELVQKLQSKGFSLEESQDVVAKFQAKGIVSDASFCEQLCYEAERGGHGRRWLINKLRQAGVDGSHIEQLLLDNDFDQDKEYLVLQNYFYKKFGSRPNFADQKKQASALRHLQGRGFTVGLIFKVMKSRGQADLLQEFDEDID